MINRGFCCSDNPQFRQTLCFIASPLLITKALVVFERLVFVMLAGIVPEFRIIRPSGKVFLR